MSDDEAAATAFGTLADPTRIAVLRAFAEALDDQEIRERVESPMPVLSFSEVYERVDVDSTSRLSYHLDELDGTYLRHTDDGWRFTFAGEAIVRLVLAGGYDGDIAFEPVAVSGSCVVCGADALRVEIDDRLLFHRCADCGSMMGGMPVSPAQLRDRDAEALLESVATRATSHFRQFREGVCGWCGGVAAMEVRRLGDADEGRLFGLARCSQCWRTLNGPPSMWLAGHPASVAFHYDHGIDVLSYEVGEFTTRYRNGDWRTEARSDDEYEVTYSVDDDALRLVVDDELAVVRAERVRRDSVGDR